MFPRITNACDIYKPINGVLDQDQVDKVNKMYENTKPKRKIARAIAILFVTLLISWTLYQALFVLEISKIAASELTIVDISLASDDILTIQFASDNYTLTKYYNITRDVNDATIIYITLKQTLIPLKRSQNQEIEMTYQSYEIDASSISKIYYMGHDSKDTFLVWER